MIFQTQNIIITSRKSDLVTYSSKFYGILNSRIFSKTIICALIKFVWNPYKNRENVLDTDLQSFYFKITHCHHQKVNCLTRCIFNYHDEMIKMLLTWTLNLKRLISLINQHSEAWYHLYPGSIVLYFKISVIEAEYSTWYLLWR